MTASDKIFVAALFAGMTVVLGSIQIWQGEATRATIEKESPAFPSSMDVVVKNESPIPVELHAQSITSDIVGVPDSEVPIPVKIVRDYGSVP